MWYVIKNADGLYFCGYEDNFEAGCPAVFEPSNPTYFTTSEAADKRRNILNACGYGPVSVESLTWEQLERLTQ